MVPIRLLQSAGKIFISRFTAFLEYILQPISVKFCQTQIDEYCQDSKNYLKVLTKWKKNQMKKPKQTESLHLVAADVTALYPTISRNLVGQALKKALQVVSPYSQKAIKSIVEMVMFCLENVITQFGKKFYKQKTGIVTGDNHSVSLANIVMHFIIEQISGNLKRTELFRRYIDDIFFISFGFNNTKSIQTALTNIFQNNGLTLTFREVNNRQTGQGVEFLDVFHQIEEDDPIGFVTKNFTKPTAAGRTFLHGNSYHPLHIFKGIIFSEAVRLRRLNERQEDYLNSINELKDKCLSSRFNKKVTQNMIQKVSTWTERFGPNNQKKQTEKNPVPWATGFPQFLQLTDKERSIKPEANVIYKRPACLANTLTKYKTLAHKQQKILKLGSSSPCGNCALCGKFSKYECMVKSVNYIKCEKNNRQVKLNQSLNCRNYGIYVANCVNCNAQYVGQTKNKFSVRWNNHRHTWKKFDISTQNDSTALLQHYKSNHNLLLARRPSLSQCFSVIFVEEPPFDVLDICEDKWFHKLGASINLQTMILPAIK